MNNALTLDRLYTDVCWQNIVNVTRPKTVRNVRPLGYDSRNTTESLNV